MTVYLDVVIFLNFAVDLLLLKAVQGLLGISGSHIRCVLGALIGGIYGGMCVLPGWTFLASVVWRTVFLGVIVCIAFGIQTQTFRAGALFCLLAFALGGAASVSRPSLLTLLLTACVLVAVCWLSFRKLGIQRFCAVKLHLGEEDYTFTALVDTGNTLVDPMTGKPVIVVGANIAASALGIHYEELEDPVAALSSRKYPGLRLIPYHSIGRKDGFMLGICPDQLYINGRKADASIAFAPQIIGNGNTYQALAGGNLS